MGKRLYLVQQIWVNARGGYGALAFRRVAPNGKRGLENPVPTDTTLA